MIQTIGKIVRNGQITIPASLRQNLHLRDGDLIRFDVEKNHLTLTPLSLLEKDQTYFHTPEWQEDEISATEDIEKGRVTKTKNIKELFKKLDS